MPHPVPRVSLPFRIIRWSAVPACMAAATAAAQPGGVSPTNPAGGLSAPASAVSVAPPMDLNVLANRLESLFKNRTVGYAIVVSYQDQEMQTRAGGSARRAPDLPARAMTVDDRINIASASKLITGAAFMHALTSRQRSRGQVSLDDPMYRYLPSDWFFAGGVDGVTLRQLLSHRSGLRCETYSTYEELRACVGQRIFPGANTERYYLNTNFGYLRLILPRLLGGRVPTTPAGLANAYQAYVHQHVLQPAGITGVECKPAASAPALAYQFPHGVGQPGGDFGDESLRCGASGWNLSARELARFGRTLFYTDRILPASVLQQMRDGGLAVEYGPLEGSVTRTGHTGYFPGANNPGQLSSIVVGLSNGVSVAIIVNSQIATAPSGPGFDLPLDAQVYQVLRDVL